MVRRIIALCSFAVALVSAATDTKIVSLTQLNDYLLEDKGKEFASCGLYEEDKLYIPRASAEFAKVNGKSRVKFAVELGKRSKTPGKVITTPWLIYKLGITAKNQGMIVKAVPEGKEAFEEFKKVAAEETNTNGDFRAFVTKTGNVGFGALLAIGGDKTIWTARVNFEKGNFFQKRRLTVTASEDEAAVYEEFKQNVADESRGEPVLLQILLQVPLSALFRLLMFFTRVSLICTFCILATGLEYFRRRGGYSPLPFNDIELASYVASRKISSSGTAVYVSKISVKFDDSGQKAEFKLQMSSRAANPGRSYTSPWLKIGFSPSCVGKVSLRASNKAAYDEFKRSLASEVGGEAVFNAFVLHSGGDTEYSLHVCAGGTLGKYCSEIPIH
ncbi:hypothetical protein FOZ61_009379 [Perkinsus olseni]|uniref:Uncharacterized protein n=1 Tax=Perkinsus olseni TaxID=32597 RepID=A0A7J6M5F6_PEROL|nr:hypothetical protein FOZ61_009379 [Perkinsus olseni]